VLANETEAVWEPSLEMLFVDTITTYWFQAAVCVTEASLYVHVNTYEVAYSQGGT